MIARAQDGMLLAARLLLAAALLPTGLARALNVSGFALTLAGAGIPAPNAVATLAVVVQVFGPLALIVGVVPRVTGLALAGFAAATALVLHAFWQESGLAAFAERTLLLADLGLAGGFLMYAAIGPGAWSWHGWRLGMTGAPKAAPKTGGGRGAQPKAGANSNRPRRPSKAA